MPKTAATADKSPSLAVPAGAPLLRAVGIRKSFRMGETDVQVLKNATLTVRAGEFVAIEGRSGSGKSTLLYVLGSLDAADAGTVEYLGGDGAAEGPAGGTTGVAAAWALLVGCAAGALVLMAAGASIAAIMWWPLIGLVPLLFMALGATGGLVVSMVAGWFLGPILRAAADRISVSLIHDKQLGRRPAWQRVVRVFSSKWAILAVLVFGAGVVGTWIAGLVQSPQAFEVADYVARKLTPEQRAAVERALERSAATYALAKTLSIWLAIAAVALLEAVAFRLTVAWLDDRLAARSRNREFGFVFQFYHLLPELTVLENTMLGQMVRNSPLGYFRARADLRARAKKVLADLGMDHRLTHRPNQLSGGERQRVAIARALMNEPRILFADEPTGNLDADTGRQIMDVIEGLHRDRGQTIVMVTHDRALAREADRVLVLRDGRLEKADG